MSVITSVPLRAIIEKKLDKHLQEKRVNNRWIYPLIYESNTVNVEAFPFRPDEMSHTKFDKYIYTSTTKQPNTLPKVEPNSKTPKYTMLIPAKGSNNKEQVPNILNLFKDQSYGTTAKESRDWVKANLAAVIALNRPQSLEETVNEEFKDQIESTKKVDGIAYRVFGFFWTFDWITKSDADARVDAKKAKAKKAKGKKGEVPKVIVQKVEDRKVKDTYLLLRYLNADAAKEVRERFEGNDDSLSDELKQIMNIQKIRERLLTEPHAQVFLDHFAKKAPNSPRYLCSQDADVQSISCQQDQKGLFEHYDGLIRLYLKRKKALPSFLPLLVMRLLW
ncbi:MAG: hypothetical protein KR126chlam6_01203 [Candidatus Anoxychlamydiales bacterium]|nr:hypothetical protein [Candidatus Anoxychlamydiales bacterium]